VPQTSDFDYSVNLLLEHSFPLENRQRPVRDQTRIQRRKCCVLFIEGLYQAFCSHTLYQVQKILGHTQRYAHSSHDTLLDATNSVNIALSGMFVPMVSTSPAGQNLLDQ
jgi:hypothetical protein